MSNGLQRLKRAFWIAYLLLVHGLAIGFLAQRFLFPLIAAGGPPFIAVSDPTASTPVPTPLPVPSEFYDAADANDNSVPVPPSGSAGSANPPIIIPVAGIRPEQLTDTFSQTRSEGRTHEAIDIMAPAGTPVLAAVDGKIIKFHDSVPGGISIYQLGADGRYIYYYAHLQRRADNLQEGQDVKQGATIGYVGDTGNPGPGNNHLHFAISVSTDPKRFWEGENINPYPLLLEAAK